MLEAIQHFSRLQQDVHSLDNCIRIEGCVAAGSNNGRPRTTTASRTTTCVRVGISLPTTSMKHKIRRIHLFSFKTRAIVGPWSTDVFLRSTGIDKANTVKYRGRYVCKTSVRSSHPTMDMVIPIDSDSTAHKFWCRPYWHSTGPTPTGYPTLHCTGTLYGYTFPGPNHCTGGALNTETRRRQCCLFPLDNADGVLHNSLPLLWFPTSLGCQHKPTTWCTMHALRLYMLLLPTHGDAYDK